MLSKIKARDGVRAELIEKMKRSGSCTMDDRWVMQIFCLISESIDDYIEHRITADKTVEGILKDIQAGIAEKAQPN